MERLDDSLKEGVRVLLRCPIKLRPVSTHPGLEVRGGDGLGVRHPGAEHFPKHIVKPDGYVTLSLAECV